MKKLKLIVLIFVIFISGCNKEKYLRTPVVETTSVTLSGTDVIVKGNVTDAGNATNLQTGFCYQMNIAPKSIMDNQVLSNQTGGTFQMTLSDLIPDSTYYFQAFVTSDQGYSTGKIISFKVPTYQPPTVPCVLATNKITDNGMTFNVTSTSIDNTLGCVISASCYPDGPMISFKFLNQPLNGIYTTTDSYDFSNNKSVFVTITEGGYNDYTLTANALVYVNNIDSKTVAISFCQLNYMVDIYSVSLSGEINAQ